MPVEFVVVHPNQASRSNQIVLRWEGLGKIWTLSYATGLSRSWANHDAQALTTGLHQGMLGVQQDCSSLWLTYSGANLFFFDPFRLCAGVPLTVVESLQHALATSRVEQPAPYQVPRIGVGSNLGRWGITLCLEGESIATPGPLLYLSQGDAERAVERLYDLCPAGTNWPPEVDILRGRPGRFDVHVRGSPDLSAHGLGLRETFHHVRLVRGFLTRGKDLPQDRGTMTRYERKIFDDLV